MTSSWDSTGARYLAGDLTLNAARQARALRSLNAGLARRSESVAAGSSRAALLTERPLEEERGRRRSLPRRRSSDQLPRRARRSQASEVEEAGSQPIFLLRA